MPFHANGGGPSIGESPPKLSGVTARAGQVLERIHKIRYSATLNKLLLDVEAAQTESATKIGTVGEVIIENTGGTPSFAILAYAKWTAATTMNENVGVGADIENFDNIMLAVKDQAELTGKALAAAQKETNELSGSGSATTIIQDNSQTTSNSSQPIVIPTDPIAVQSTTRLE